VLAASVQCNGRHSTDEEAGDEQRVSLHRGDGCTGCLSCHLPATLNMQFHW